MHLPPPCPPPFDQGALNRFRHRAHNSAVPQNPSPASLEALRSPLDLHPPFTELHGRALTINALASGALELSHRPATTLWPSTAHPSQEREGIEEEEGAPDVTGVAGAEDVAPINHVDAAARHGMASSRHGHDPPLHRHPLAIDPDSESLAAETPSPMDVVAEHAHAVLTTPPSWHGHHLRTRPPR